MKAYSGCNRKISNHLRGLFKVFLFAMISILIFGCKSRNAKVEVVDTPVLSEVNDLDSISSGTWLLIPLVDKQLSIPDSAILIQKIRTLMDSVSYYNFNGLKIEVLGIDTSENSFKTLKINLKENPGFLIPDSLGNNRSWYDFFQGSTGGQKTTLILVESTLQRSYKGDWIDAVEFSYQGELIGVWDHINLEGQIKRF